MALLSITINKFTTPNKFPNKYSFLAKTAGNYTTNFLSASFIDFLYFMHSATNKQISSSKSIISIKFSNNSYNGIIVSSS